MTVYFDKKREAWKFDFWRDNLRHFGYCVHPDGRPAANKTEARRIEDGHKVAAQNRPEARIGTPHGYTMAQACLAYLGTLEGRKSFRDARRHIQEILQTEWFQPHVLVTDISDQDVLDYRRWCQTQPKKVWIGGPVTREVAAKRQEEELAAARLAIGANGGPPIEPEGPPPVEKSREETRSPATTNRYLGTLRAVFSLAHKMRDPVTRKRLLPDPPNLELLKEPERDPRPVPDEVLERIAPHAEPHLVKALWLMRVTGMRLEETVTARASRCNFSLGIYMLPAEMTKSKRDEPMPLTPAALDTLRILVEEARAAGRDELILYTPPAPKGCPPERAPKPRPVKSLRRAWEGAQRRAGIGHPYRIHDVRAAFITSIAMVAADRVTQSLARHVSAATTARYVRVVDQARRAAVEAASMPRLAIAGTRSAAPGPNPNSQSGTVAAPEKTLKLLK